MPDLRFLDLQSSYGNLGSHVQTPCHNLLAFWNSRQDVHLANLGVFQWDLADFEFQYTSSPPILSNLQSLILRSDGHPHRTDILRLEKCLSLLTLPTLKSFARIQLEDRVGADHFKVSLAHLHHLELDRCMLSSDSILTLLEACEGLQSLEIAFENPDTTEVEVDLGEDLLSSLYSRSETLERLALLMPNGYGFEHSVELPTPFDLHPLQSLRYLEIDMYVLFAMRDLVHYSEQKLRQQLPTALEQLILRCCNSLVMPQLSN